jgi:hypothetical protein
MTESEKKELLHLAHLRSIVRNEIIMRDRVLKGRSNHLKKVEEMTWVHDYLQQREKSIIVASNHRQKRHLVRRDIICGLGQAADHIYTVKQGNPISREDYDFILMMLHEAQNYLIKEQDDEDCMA